MRNAVLVLLLSLSMAACSGPIGPIPGGELSGESAPWPADWAYTDKVENVLLQTNPNDPYSVTIWCVTHNDELFFGAGDKDSKWVANILHNPSVKLSINGKLIDGNASEVKDTILVGNVISAFLTKYDIESEEDLVQEEGMLFRFDKP